MTISELTSIPRPTVLRKLKNLLKKKEISEDKFLKIGATYDFDKSLESNRFSQLERKIPNSLSVLVIDTLYNNKISQFESTNNKSTQKKLTQQICEELHNRRYYFISVMIIKGHLRYGLISILIIDIRLHISKQF